LKNQDFAWQIAESWAGFSLASPTASYWKPKALWISSIQWRPSSPPLAMACWSDSSPEALWNMAKNLRPCIWLKTKSYLLKMVKFRLDTFTEEKESGDY
jgi:hypothetical protein